MKHYISMGGLSGYLPSFCNVHERKGDAIEYIAFIHEKSPNYVRKLFSKGVESVYVPIESWGNNVVEIVECHCESPHEHDGDFYGECFSCGESTLELGYNIYCINDECKYFVFVDDRQLPNDTHKKLNWKSFTELQEILHSHSIETNGLTYEEMKESIIELLLNGDITL